METRLRHCDGYGDMSFLIYLDFPMSNKRFIENFAGSKLSTEFNLRYDRKNIFPRNCKINTTNF